MTNQPDGDAALEPGTRERPISFQNLGAAWYHSARVSFGECDPAGIAFAPRYFEIYARAIEAFYVTRLGLDHRALVGQRRIGLAYAKLCSEYFAPLTYGDEVRIYCVIARVGTSSFELVVHLFRDESEMARGRSVNVAISLETMKPIPLPSDIRRAFDNYILSCKER